MKGSAAVALSVAALAGHALALPVKANEIQGRETAPEAKAAVAPAVLPHRVGEAVGAADTINIRHEAINQPVKRERAKNGGYCTVV
ncbi:hypothetical protein AUP68_13739 [Ilyonectria robusta]